MSAPVFSRRNQLINDQCDACDVAWLRGSWLSLLLSPHVSSLSESHFRCCHHQQMSRHRQLSSSCHDHNRQLSYPPNSNIKWSFDIIIHIYILNRNNHFQDWELNLQLGFYDRAWHNSTGTRSDHWDVTSKSNTQAFSFWNKTIFEELLGHFSNEKNFSPKDY